MSLANRAKMTVSGTPGTGAITLGSAATGAQGGRTFAAAGITDGATVSYTVEDPTGLWEIGRGTYLTAGPTLQRNYVMSNSAGTTAPLNLTSAAVVYVSALKEDLGLGGPAGIGNFDPLMMPRAAAALSRAAGGGGDATVIWISDSTGFGAWSADGATALDNAHANALPALVARDLEEFVHTSIDNRGGDNACGTIANLILSDPTISTTDWSIAPGATAGGFILQSTVNNATFTITPPGVWDTFTAYYIRAFDGSAQNVGDLKVDGPGGETATVVAKTGVGESVEAVTITRATPGTGAVTLTSLIGSGETTYVPAYKFSNSKRSTVHMVNLGIRAGNSGTGSTTPLGWNRVGGGQPWIMRNAIQGIWKPDLSLINLAINVFRSGGSNVGVTAYKAEIQSLIDACRISGDVALVIPNDVSDADEGPVDSALYARAIIELAEANGLPWINFRTALGLYAPALAAGLMKDGLHPTKAGYTRAAQSLLPIFTGLLKARVGLDRRTLSTSTAYTLSMANHATPLDIENASAIGLTLPNSLPAGFNTLVTQGGAGQISITLDSGATLRNRSSHSKTAGQWAQIGIEVRKNVDGVSAEYVLSGDTAA